MTKVCSYCSYCSGFKLIFTCSENAKPGGISDTSARKLTEDNLGNKTADTENI